MENLFSRLKRAENSVLWKISSAVLQNNIILEEET